MVMLDQLIGPSNQDAFARESMARSSRSLIGRANDMDTVLRQPAALARLRRQSARSMSNAQAEWRELMVAALAGNTGAYRRLLVALTPSIRAFVVKHGERKRRYDCARHQSRQKTRQQGTPARENISRRRSGTSDDRPPERIPTKATLANPHTA